ncbi:MAG: 2-dehydropantoate 2-reductase, partial [Colwellia sp.]
MTNRLDNIVVVGQGAMGLLWYHHLSQNNIALSASANTNINNKVTLLASNQESLSSSELKTTRYQFTPYKQNHAKNQSLIYSNQTDIKSADIILLCLKSFHIASAIKKI